MTRKSSSILAAALLLTTLVFPSCSTPPKAAAPEAAAMSAAADAMAETISEDPEEVAALRGGIESFLAFIAEERGPEAGRDIAAMRKPAELSDYLASRFGMTAYEEALAAYRYWAKRPSGPKWDLKKAERLETEHFAIVAIPGTKGYADREYLAHMLERQVENVTALIGPNEAMSEGLARNLASVKGAKVEVVLPPDPRGLKDFNSTATTNYGMTLSGSEAAIYASILLPYYNSLSSAVLTHEVTHVLDIFFKLDARSAPPLPADDASPKEKRVAKDAFIAWAKPTFQAIMPSDRDFGEGFAEFSAERFSPLHRAFFPDPDAMLGVMWKRVPPLEDLLVNDPTKKDRSKRIVRYTELSSFVTYLVDSYGLDRFLDFYMGVPLEEARFIRVYGKDFKEMQAEWRAARPLADCAIRR
jgi:hypothetical protein